MSQFSCHIVQPQLKILVGLRFFLQYFVIYCNAFEAKTANARF